MTADRSVRTPILNGAGFCALARASELEALVARHGGKLESFGHPTTTLEDLFKRVVEESKARPGRRYLPPGGANGASPSSARACFP